MPRSAKSNHPFQGLEKIIAPSAGFARDRDVPKNRLQHLIPRPAETVDIPINKTHRHIIRQHLKALQLSIPAMRWNEWFIAHAFEALSRNGLVPKRKSTSFQQEHPTRLRSDDQKISFSSHSTDEQQKQHPYGKRPFRV